MTTMLNATPATQASLQPPRRLKVLLSAYACEPGKGSEPGVGWNMVQTISRHHDVWVITAEEHRASIEKMMRENPISNVEWVIQNLPFWLTFWKKGERGRRIHYYMWQVKAYFTVKRLHERVKFDLVHHITYVTYWTPSFISQLDVPFIWGPVGGAESAPGPFRSTLSTKSKVYEIVRDAVRWLGANLDPYVRATARRARIGLATTQESAAVIRRLGTKDVRLLPESGLPNDEIGMLNSLPIRQNAAPFRLISMGRLLGWKGFHLGVRAFAEFQKEYSDSEYWILGEGGEQDVLQALARELGIGDKVKFFGRMPREQALQHLAESEVLVHPSLHDSGGWVCLEAMAAGRPVVCLDLGGPGVQVVDGQTGFKISASQPDQAVHEMAQALLKLAQNPQLRIEMGAAGRQHVWDNFNWESKGLQIDRLYHEVMQHYTKVQ